MEGLLSTVCTPFNFRSNENPILQGRTISFFLSFFFGSLLYTFDLDYDTILKKTKLKIIASGKNYPFSLCWHLKGELFFLERCKILQRHKAYGHFGSSESWLLYCTESNVNAFTCSAVNRVF